jgi:sirohydrochlorin ferrochelatase
MDVIIILSHGSKNKNSNVLTARVAEEVGKELGAKTVMANLQLSSPYLHDIVEREYEEGARRFIIHPFFLHNGVHVEEDIPEEIESLQKEYPDAVFVMTGVTGDHPFISKAATEMIRKSL